MNFLNEQGKESNVKAIKTKLLNLYEFKWLQRKNGNTDFIRR